MRDAEHPSVRGLRTAIRDGHGEAYAGVYRSGASLDAYLPGETVHSQGRDEIAATLGRWHNAPAQIVRWSAEEFRQNDRSVGFDVDVQWHSSGEQTHTRRRHYLHLSDGRVVRHIAFAARPRSERTPGGEPGPVLAALLSSAVDCTLTPSGAGGACIERVLTQAGDTLFVKYTSRATDWQMRATEDAGREATLWLEGHLDRLPASVSHAIVGAERVGHAGWAVTSRDVRPYLAPRRISPAQMRAHLSSLRDLHLTFLDHPPGGLSTIARRWGVFWPETCEREYEECDQMPKQVARGWDLLDKVVDDDVAAVVRRIASDPGVIADRLSDRRLTLLHGDAHTRNLALSNGRSVLLDWSLATMGPPAVEAAWLANFAHQFDFSVDEMLDAVPVRLGQRA
jgi:hypothetical protein